MREPEIGDVYEWDYEDGTIVGEITHVGEVDEDEEIPVSYKFILGTGVYEEHTDSTGWLSDVTKAKYMSYYNTKLYRTLNVSH